MKIGIIAPNSLRYCPYIFLYTDILQECGIDFDVIYPDRYGLNEQLDFPVKVFQWDKRKNAAIQFLEYSHFVSQTVKKNRYDKLVVLTTGQGVLLLRLLKRYAGKYVYDIRDYTHEDKTWFRKREEKVIKMSGLMVISSEEFKSFLPTWEYTIVFNAPQSLTTEDTFIKKPADTPIIIGYVGSIAYTKQCFRLMALVEKDDRFRFELYGNDMHGDAIAQRIQSQNYTHSQYHGSYTASEKAAIVRKCDILFNAYGNDRPMLRCALSNKLTDAAMYKRVVLNSPDTYMDRILSCCSYAIDLEKEKNLDGLYTYYEQLDVSEVNAKLNALCDEIISTNNATKIIIERFLKE